MRIIRTILMALLALMAAGAVSAVSAHADNVGHLDTDVFNCDVTYSDTGWTAATPPFEATTMLDTFDIDPNGSCEYELLPGPIDSVEATMDVSREPIDPLTGYGDGEITGEFQLEFLTGLIRCTYAFSLSAAWHWADPPTESIAQFEVNPIPQSATRVSGSALFCPSLANFDDWTQLEIGPGTPPNPNIGHIETSLGDCDVEFSHGGWYEEATGPTPAHDPPWKRATDISGIGIQSGGGCDVAGISGNIHVHENDSGAAKLISTIVVPGPAGNCSYSGIVDASSSWANPTESLRRLELVDGQELDLDSGASCPDPVAIDGNGNSWIQIDGTNPS